MQEGFVVRVIHFQVTHFWQRTGSGNTGCKCQRTGHQVAFNQLIKQFCLHQFFRGHRCTGDDHVQRHLKTNDAWQTLGTAGAWQDAKLDFRQRNLRTRRDDTIVAAERQFQPATHADGMDRGNDRLVAIFDRADHGVQGWFGQCFRRIEFLDVGTAGKCLAGTGDDDCLDCVVLLRAAHAFDDRSTRGETEAVYRRVVERDDGNRAVKLIFCCHDSSLIEDGSEASRCVSK